MYITALIAAAVVHAQEPAPLDYAQVYACHVAAALELRRREGGGGATTLPRDEVIRVRDTALEILPDVYGQSDLTFERLDGIERDARASLRALSDAGHAALIADCAARLPRR